LSLTESRHFLRPDARRRAHRSPAEECSSAREMVRGSPSCTENAEMTSSYPTFVHLSVFGGLLTVFGSFAALFAYPSGETAGALCIGAGVALIGLLSAREEAQSQ
jgi:hypothetical protein